MLSAVPKFSAELKYDPFNVVYSRGPRYYDALRRLQHELKEIPDVTIDFGVACIDGCAGETQAKYDYFHLRNAAGRKEKIESKTEWVWEERARPWRDSLVREWVTGTRKKLFKHVLDAARQLSASNESDLVTLANPVSPDYGEPEESPTIL